MTVARTTVGASTSSLAPLQSFLAEVWLTEHLPDSGRFPFELALEEVFMNVVMHGSHARTDVWTEVTFEHTPGWVQMSIRDNGNPFDPLSLEPPDVDAAMHDRPVGGLGVHLVRTLMDEVTYHLEDGCNVLVMRKRLETGA